MSEAIITTATRRFVEICDRSFSFHRCILASRSFSPVIGDIVSYEKRGNEYVVTSIKERRNIVKRSVANREKIIASNVDLLLVITAPGPLFNTYFIDRISVAAHNQNIPFILVLNKFDLALGKEFYKKALDIYSDIARKILCTSALTADGVCELKQTLLSGDIKLAVLMGISGVGKSSLMNRLIPNLTLRTQQVSKQTGQGKQTTSQSFAFRLHGESSSLLLVDTPGIQNFGLAYMNEVDVKKAFPEFRGAEKKCRFKDCMHMDEDICGVKEGISEGYIKESRYATYLSIIQEIQSARKW